MGNNEGLPKRLNQKAAQLLLEQDGWTTSRGGKHVIKMTKPGRRPVTLPMHNGNDYSPGLTSAILKQAGLKGAQQDVDRTGTEGET